MNDNLFEEIKKYTFRAENGAFKFAKKRQIEKNYVGGESVLSPKETEYYLREKSKIWNIVVLFVVVLAVALTFAGRSFYLQIIEGEEKKALAENNRIRQYRVRAERGIIYDRNGEVLVRNKPAFSLEMDPRFCDDSYNPGAKSCEQTLMELSKFVDIEEDRVMDDIQSGKSVVVLSSNLSKEMILTVEPHLAKYPSTRVVISPERDYIFGPAFAHLLGYVGLSDQDNTPVVEGKMGVEESYNQELSGVDGQRVVQVDSSGATESVLYSRDTIPGQSMTLNVDSGLQNLAYDLLKKTMDEGDATGGAVVAQDPETGGILALVSYPSFDPGELSLGITSKRYKELISQENYPFFNRAISAAYPPGSTFKLMMAAAALTEKVVTPEQEILDTGALQIGSYIYRGWRSGGHGLVDMKRAIQVSNDIYFYVIGGGYGEVVGLGIQKIHDWAQKFGYGTILGIDISGEVSGFIPDGTRDSGWYLGDTYITSIGQGDVLATPLQVNSVTNYYANGGYLLKPQVLKETDGLEESEVEVISQNLTDAGTYEIIREGMKAAVEPGGTAYPLFDFPVRHPGIELAGKTGTSEFGPADEEKTHAWFTVFGPYENASISLTVFLEGGGGGSDDAAPVAKELLDYWFSE